MAFCEEKKNEARSARVVHAPRYRRGSWHPAGLPPRAPAPPLPPRVLLLRAQRERDARRAPMRSRRKRSEARQAARPATRGCGSRHSSPPTHLPPRANPYFPLLPPRTSPRALRAGESPRTRRATRGRARDAAPPRGWQLNLPPILRVTVEPSGCCGLHLGCRAGGTRSGRGPSPSRRGRHRRGWNTLYRRADHNLYPSAGVTADPGACFSLSACVWSTCLWSTCLS